MGPLFVIGASFSGLMFDAVRKKNMKELCANRGQEPDSWAEGGARGRVWAGVCRAGQM